MIIGVDQVMLDLVVEVDDDAGIFDRHGIARKTQSLADATNEPLFQHFLARSAMQVEEEEEEEMPTIKAVQKTPGGVVSNALRAAAFQHGQVASRLCCDPKPELRMLGMVGKDAAADRLKLELNKAGVLPMFAEKPSKEGDECIMSKGTGLCLCLIANKERTMLTSLGAGKTMKLDGSGGAAWPSWAARMEEVMAARDAAQADLPIIVCISGFYIKEDPEGSRAILRWCRETRKEGRPRPLLAVTVAAEWCCGIPIVQELAHAADFLFANEPEVNVLAEHVAQTDSMCRKGSVSDCAVTSVAQWKDHGWMIATRGARSVGVLRCGLKDAALSQPSWVPVPRLPAEEFVDDVGAGDSFMGGFLASVWLSVARATPREDRPWLPCCNARQSTKAWPEEVLARDPASAMLSVEDVEAACRAGIATAAACCRSVGCQFTAP